MSDREREQDSKHTVDLFVPGRLCLFGEHSDWAGTYRHLNPSIEKGHAIVCGTQQGLYAHVKPHPHQFIVHSHVNANGDGEAKSESNHKSFACDMTAEALTIVAKEGGFWSYACGVAFEVLSAYGNKVKGLEIDNYKTDLPVKKGLSSSAALCVLVARGFSKVYGLALPIEREMDLAFRGEILTSSQCGRLDQCCAYGSTVVLVTFDNDDVTTRKVQLKQPLHVVLVDLNAKKDTKLILQSLNDHYPVPNNQIGENLHMLLGKTNADIVARAVEAMEKQQNPSESLGELMVEAQRQFDLFAQPVCPKELTAPKLHTVLQHPAIATHIHGGKGVGSQGDGTAQFICKSKEDQQAVTTILERDFDVSCLQLSVGGIAPQQQE